MYFNAAERSILVAMIDTHYKLEDRYAIKNLIRTLFRLNIMIATK
jgi:hypothetical protein